jgi:hypothetical protein
MTKFALRLAGEESSRVFESAAEADTLDGLAREMVETGYLLGKMKLSERVPEAQGVAIPASQIRWLALAATSGGSRY